MCPRESLEMQLGRLEHVDYDGRKSKASLTFKASGLLSLIEAWARTDEEKRT
jgi:hypothetical protein